MTESKRVIRTDLAKLDAHEIPPQEYEEIPEATDEWFDKAELAVDGEVVRPARRHPDVPNQTQLKSASRCVSIPM